MKRGVLMLLICAGLTLSVVVVALSVHQWQHRQQGTTCAAFASQASAQMAYRSNPSGLAHLDADKDGLACEAGRVPRDLTPVATARRA